MSQSVYLIFITNNHASFRLQQLKKYKKVIKYYDHDCL